MTLTHHDHAVDDLRGTDATWVPVCPLDTLVPGRGVAAILPDGTQAAVFLVPSGEVFAVGNIDPFGRAAVMSRGLVGDRDGEPTVASPLLKQVFSLRTGLCLDDDSVGLGTFATRVVDNRVDIGA
ncbi:nitrite reductase small subunit NirD [Williamsia deligens]|uniref:Nitrite reductase small subunit NirD n=1 Tax=Williamsia deligens TaxID=321325 RepID=A0ABW3G275_9NOCA|nr:nitrite reductase small subunit NirD [Williamsia deligens]MCP2194833.1 nitrite reductase (NADH) small subunit [Williamsia deligens]